MAECSHFGWMHFTIFEKKTNDNNYVYVYIYINVRQNVQKRAVVWDLCLYELYTIISDWPENVFWCRRCFCGNRCIYRRRCFWYSRFPDLLYRSLVVDSNFLIRPFLCLSCNGKNITPRSLIARHSSNLSLYLSTRRWRSRMFRISDISVRVVDLIGSARCWL